MDVCYVYVDIILTLKNSNWMLCITIFKKLKVLK